MERPKIQFDPRMFISAPYIECPKCKKESFGVLSVGRNVYTRRCKECWHSETFKLPELHKIIIYLDQFVISEMMKAIHTKLGKTDKVDPFWLHLFEKLERLSHLQLIVCPDSHFHQQESLLYEYKAHRRMYEQLSHGTTFFDPGTIHRFQVQQRFQQWLGLKDDHGDITARDVIHGDPDAWQEKFIISVDFEHGDEEISSIRRSRDAAHEGIAEVFARWRNEPKKKFIERFEEEGLAWGRVMIQKYITSLVKEGLGQATMEDFVISTMSDESILITGLSMYLPHEPEKTEENLRKMSMFLQSEDMLQVPFNRLSALMWAAIADQAAHDATRKPPNKGVVNDIDMISTLLPYCDAMFIDRDMYGLLQYGPLRIEAEKGYPAKIFSTSNKEAFMEYLDGLEKNADPKLLATIREVYGEPTAYTTMYERDGWEDD